MKYEETSDMSTILVEPTDKRSTVMTQISMQNKPVVLVVPTQASAVFQLPGHFYELKRLKRELGISITFVITGHERLRNLARRQGFPVYASQETCARALARRDRLYAMRGLAQVQDTFLCAGDDDDNDDDVPWSWEVKGLVQEDAQCRAASRPVVEMSPISGMQWACVGEPLWDVSWGVNGMRGYQSALPATPLLPGPQGTTANRVLRTTRLVGLVEEDEEISTRDTGEMPLEIAPQTRYAPETGPLSEWSTQPQQGEKLSSPLGVHQEVNNKVVWLLAVLLTLGVLGGIGSGYALWVLHVPFN